ncbi:hypothetical protein [Nostoc sp. PA-18-2419]|uniref:hypothetical protein n=1 Tax=Nostoc sp. PA-18-2419 TaxID=2575443 RepID=UPI0016770C37|nr:hypothetical protein [Nostoc sp. PA-18-2419]
MHCHRTAIACFKAVHWYYENSPVPITASSTPMTPTSSVPYIRLGLTVTLA